MSSFMIARTRKRKIADGARDAKKQEAESAKLEKQKKKEEEDHVKKSKATTSASGTPMFGACKPSSFFGFTGAEPLKTYANVDEFDAWRNTGAANGTAVIDNFNLDLLSFA